MLPKNLLPPAWRDDTLHGRELTRLELVGAACEVAVVAAHLDENLAPVSGDDRARELRDRCWEHRRVALELLAPETRFEEYSEEGLLGALDAFHERLRDVMRLRRHVERLLRGGDSQWVVTGT